MCLTYHPVEAFQSCHITHSKSGRDWIWPDLTPNQILTILKTHLQWVNMQNQRQKHAKYMLRQVKNGRHMQ